MLPIRIILPMLSIAILILSGCSDITPVSMNEPIVPGVLGLTPKISGRVFDTDNFYRGQPLTVIDQASGEFNGTISGNGVFSMTLGTPTIVLPITEIAFLLGGWMDEEEASTLVFDFDTPNFDAAEARCLIVSSMVTSDNRDLTRFGIWEHESLMQYRVEIEYYVYTNTNLALSAPFTSASIDLGLIYESAAESFSMRLTEGWNVFRIVTIVEHIEERNTITNRYRVVLGENTALPWVLSEPSEY